MSMDVTAKVFIAGHRGVVGKALVRRLQREGFGNLLLRSRQEVDLSSATDVDKLFSDARPEVVIIAAARVGGIAANVAHPVEFLVENLAIQNNLLVACQRYEVTKTVFLGSSCIYPRLARQPMREEYFMTGPLEPTNESYAVAKIAGIRLAQALAKQYGVHVLCPMPCNVYGPGDHFEFERAHVVSSLVRRFSEAKERSAPCVELWGTGMARREFLHVDDLADACLFLLRSHDSAEIINVGSGVDYSIAELATLVGEAVGFRGAVRWDESKPDGMPQKLLDVSKMAAIGWRSTISFPDGLVGVVKDYRGQLPRLAVSS